MVFFPSTLRKYKNQTIFLCPAVTMNIIVSASKTCQNKPVRAVTGRHLTCCHGRCDSLLLVDGFLMSSHFTWPRMKEKDAQIPRYTTHGLILWCVEHWFSHSFPRLVQAAFTCVHCCCFPAVMMQHDGSTEQDPWRSDTHSSDPHGTHNAHLVEDISLTAKVEMRQDSRRASVGNR